MVEAGTDGAPVKELGSREWPIAGAWEVGSPEGLVGSFCQCSACTHEAVADGQNFVIDSDTEAILCTSCNEDPASRQKRVFVEFLSWRAGLKVKEAARTAE